jgi:hypothetical protein
MSSELEQKIASALNGADLTSTDITKLIAEVEAAAAAAGEAAVKVREDALNPSTIVDAAEVGGWIASAELTRDRLKVAVPKLQRQWHEVALAESIAAWQVDFDKIRDERDAVAAEWNERYPQLVDESRELDEARCGGRSEGELRYGRPAAGRSRTARER